MTKDERQEPALVEKVELEGRVFRPATATTFEQDFYLMDRIEEAGLEKMVEGLTPDGDLEQFSRDLLLRAYRSGKMFEILAGVMVEEEAGGWTPEEAEVNAEFFRGLTHPSDKEAIQGVLVGVVLGFFVNAGSSFRTSPKSLMAVETPAPQPTEKRGLDSATGVRFNSESGET